MKPCVYVEYAGKQVAEADIIKQAKALWTESGHKVGEIESLNIYVKPEDQMVYVTINDTFSEKFAF